MDIDHILQLIDLVGTSDPSASRAIAWITGHIFTNSFSRISETTATSLDRRSVSYVDPEIISTFRNLLDEELFIQKGTEPSDFKRLNPANSYIRFVFDEIKNGKDASLVCLLTSLIETGVALPHVNWKPVISRLFTNSKVAKKALYDFVLCQVGRKGCSPSLVDLFVVILKNATGFSSEELKELMERLVVKLMTLSGIKFSDNPFSSEVFPTQAAVSYFKQMYERAISLRIQVCWLFFKIF